MTQLLDEPEALRLAHVLAVYDEALLQALESHEPSALVQHLFLLARAANAAHAKLRVVGESAAVAAARAALFSAARHGLQHGLQLLGLRPLEEM